MASDLSFDGPGDGLITLEVGDLHERRSLREHIAHVLRAALVSGQLRAGVVYSVPTLAARFGVSATPVREAMLDLAKEGLVEAVRNKGFRVTELGERELDEITELRLLVEVPTVTRLARSITGEDVDRLRPLAERISECAAQGDLIGYVDADRAFHLALLALAGNQRLVDLVRDLRAQSRLYGLQSLAERGALASSSQEHTELLDLLARHDVAAAEALIRRHIGHVRGVWAASTAPVS